MNIRWLTAKDPAYFEVLNRPNVDLALRQLILSKAIDNLYASLGHEALYPYLLQPQVAAGKDLADVPINWIWSINVAVPQQWEQFRLAKIKRIRGVNGDGGSNGSYGSGGSLGSAATDISAGDVTNTGGTGYTGALRVIFSANVIGNPQEIALFWVDYQIDSVLTYQPYQLQVVTIQEESYTINPDQASTIAGSITFWTLDTTTLINSSFLNLLAPPVANQVGTDGNYLAPAIYEIVDTVGGGAGATNDFAMLAVSHGTGIMTEAAWLGLPPQQSDAQAWVNSMNYPFDLAASRLSVDGITIPQGLFREFHLVVPAGDEPSDTSDSSYFPIWIDSAQYAPPAVPGTTSQTPGNTNQIRFFFSTYNDTETATGGAPSLQPIQFAYLDIYRTGQPADRLPVIPYNNLKLDNSQYSAYFGQHIGRGHVVLSSLWDNTTTDITDFWDDMAALLESPQITTFTKSTTRIASYGMSSVPKYVPTMGQSRALLGTTSYWTSPVPPNEANRFVVEQDQGLGNVVDLEALTGIIPQAAIERYGYCGSLCHKMFKLVVYADELPTDSNFYTNQILPRIVALLGRQPTFGDIWYNGTRFVIFNGDAWQD